MRLTSLRLMLQCVARLTVLNRDLDGDGDHGQHLRRKGLGWRAP
jgi:hypothetical protein